MPSEKVARAVCAISIIYAAMYGLVAPLAYAARWGVRRGYWVYDAAQGAVSYFDTGFARRELEGTLLSPFHADPMAAAVGFHLATYGIFAALGIAFICRPGLLPGRRLALCATFAAILARIALDVGRADAAVMICGLLAAWAASTGRWLGASVAIVVALLFHETGLIVLGPLALGAAYAARSYTSWRWSSPSALGAIAVMCGGLLAYLVSLHAVDHLPAVARRIHGAFLDPDWADLATFANLTGSRGMLASVCNNTINPAYPARVAAGAAVCLLLSIGLHPDRPRLAVLITLPPFLFLSLISTDIGRWATFGAFSLAAISLVTEPRAPPGPSRTLALALALSVAALMVAGLDYRSVVFAPVPALESFVQGHGMASPDPLAAITECEPGWRAAIGL